MHIKQAIIFSIFLFFFKFSFSQKIITGAEQTEQYLPYIEGKKVALVVNQTSVINRTHLVDSLLKLNIDIQKIFAPEHGFRGNHADGEEVNDSKDKRTGLNIISLYGNNKKPTKEQLKNIDVVIFDIQDVGARFYTFLSTLHYVMEACAESKIKLIVLDRPNPNGNKIDGPVLDTSKYKSFIGMHPVPITYGMTIGEYACMINGEKWLANGVKCDLEIFNLINYNHDSEYVLPIAPSPNLPTQASIIYYPFICLFEGTEVSLGRGTEKPFTSIGAPWFDGKYQFTPISIPGVSDNPPLKNKLCKGFDLTKEYQNKTIGFDLKWLLLFYKNAPEKSKFFIPYFEKLAGTGELRKQIQNNETETQIKASWQKDLTAFKLIRKKYLRYE